MNPYFNPSAPIDGDGLSFLATLHTNYLSPSVNPPAKQPNFEGYPERYSSSSARGIWESRYDPKENQAFRRGQNSWMHVYRPQANPPKSRRVTGYTPPFQVFDFRHTWQMPAGRQAGSITRNPSQPSVLYPQGPEQIATAMPWNR